MSWGLTGKFLLLEGLANIYLMTVTTSQEKKMKNITEGKRGMKTRRRGKL